MRKKAKTDMISKSQVVALLTGAVLATFLLTLSDVLGQAPESTIKQPAGVRASYARAALHLAEVDLRIALTTNTKIANLYSPSTIRRLRNNVAYAEKELNYELNGEESSLHDLHLQEVEIDLQVAESELEEALQLNRRLPGSFDDLQIDRLRATKEVARLALDLAREPAVMRSHNDHLQWQLNRIRSEVTRLYVLMDKALARN